MGGALAELPKYRSHKIVHALEIAKIEYDYVVAAKENRETDGSATIYPVLADRYAPFKVDVDYVVKHLVYADVKIKGNNYRQDGYYVLYKDGYKSWSPKEAFEAGNTPIYEIDKTLHEELMNERIVKMPTYAALRTVSAIRIAELRNKHVSPPDGSVIIVPEKDIANFRVERDFIITYKPKVGGYYLIEDGCEYYYSAEKFDQIFGKKIPPLDISPYNPVHANWKKDCPGVFNIFDEEMIICCNECGMTINELIEHIESPTLLQDKVVVNRFKKICEESLDRDKFESFKVIMNDLIKIRPGMTD